MGFQRTPDHHFENLHDYDFAPNYVNIIAQDDTVLRMHYLDEGDPNGELILCLHGQPAWSYLYRKMIPILTNAGYRVIAPDLIGFGKSDKPSHIDDYSYQIHSDWLAQFIEQLDLKNINLICQDWGGMLGLRYAGLNPDRFARLIIANTGLIDNQSMPEIIVNMLTAAYDNIPVPNMQEVNKQFNSGEATAFLYWVKYCAENPDFNPRDVFAEIGTFSEAELDAYNAPFPDASYHQAARKFPSCVPMMKQHQKDRDINDKAWAGLEAFEKPVLLAFADNDPVTAGADKTFKKRCPGVKKTTPVSIKNGGHFLQDTASEAFSTAIIDFIKKT